MNAPLTPVRFAAADRSSLAARLRRELDAEVMFDAASRGRYSTDASIYQLQPIGIVVPRTEEAARGAIAIAAAEGIPILPRGAGSSQCGQAVGEALVIDHTKYLNRALSIDAQAAAAIVQPGIVLDALNAQLRPHGLWFPVDVSTSAQATLGGMAGNNSCGSRSIAYGNMVHNVAAIEAVTVAGERWTFGRMDEASGPEGYRDFVKRLKGLYERERAEIEARFPRVLRKVAGYNLDHLGPPHANAAHLLVGSEGTLAYSERLHLKLSRLPKARTLGVCHFARFYAAMDCTQHIVKLGPSAVELVDQTMIGLARGIAAFRGTVDAVIKGDPEAILLVEFSGDDASLQQRKLKDLVQLMADLGQPGSVVELTDARIQRELWEVRKAGLNIMMSMKGDGKPVSFIEDCAVPLEHLAEYTDRLTRVFAKHGTRGTWYAHASVGTLHVRPILDMRRDGAEKMRAIAEEACAMVKEYKGAYSGEHGDGLVRSEWIAPFFGPRLTACLAEIKGWLDPRGLMNPGKIVDPPRMDDRSLFRFKPGYETPSSSTYLDWSEWGGYDKAVEMCNNNGHCRKFDAGTMCPSYRATLDEAHLTRGRANTLRLALSNQLGAEADEAVKAALDLCVSCKGCKRECPTGVDMARMKIEYLARYKAKRGHSLRDRAIAYLPRYAPWAGRLAPLANAVASMGRPLLGFSSQRELPRWRSDYFEDRAPPTHPTRAAGREVVLFVDTFNRWFEPENVHAAVRVLEAAGCSVHAARPLAAGRPLCCGRTFLTAGMVDQARTEARRTLEALRPHLERGAPVIGLEPSCLFSFRDEYAVLFDDALTQTLAENSFLLEEYLAREPGALRLKEMKQEVLLHGHCHQKAFDAMPAVEKVLRMVPGLEVSTVQTSCCGMAGSFGYEAEHYGVSMKMAELSLLPSIRNSKQAVLVADGTSCRHQIVDGTGREALHVARVLDSALER
ncbi:MAG TPA: FAD-linked oxidase C-terminal domain-containing protein [Burkholderiales bacterium]|jgi:FAD/FMN-containing dehydrogenase/Fe-S oxidoreductase|nr:FAD-linked oxidase C-terminal domain-containing protein [Burkholderiales bacterium]